MASRPRCSKRGTARKDDVPSARKPLGDISALQNSAQPCARKCQKTCVVDGPRNAKPPTRKPCALQISQIPETVGEGFMGGGSDFEEPSSDSSPHQPIWLCKVPQKHRLAVESMLSGAVIQQKERDLIIRDCCSTFKVEEHVEDFLQWMGVEERMTSLTTKLLQTSVRTIPSTTVLPYADDIYENLLSREERFAITPDYMETMQPDITHNMRSILVDWLVEVGEEYKLSSQTLCLAVNYVDRLLGMRPISRNKLQLVGITCMLVAAKYEEIFPPSIDEFVYIADNTYTKQDVLTTECILLSSLQFNLSAPTSWEFVRCYCSSASIEKRPKFLAHFLAELFMMFSSCLKYRASMIAASAIFLAVFTLYLPSQLDGLLRLAGNNKDLLLQCVEDLHAAHKKVLEGSFKAIREKFQEAKWLRVSLIPSRVLD